MVGINLFLICISGRDQLICSVFFISGRDQCVLCFSTVVGINKLLCSVSVVAINLFCVLYKWQGSMCSVFCISGRRSVCERLPGRQV